MSQIIDLLNTLDTKLVVFFDDKCTSTDNPYKILVNLFKLSNIQQQFIFNNVFLEEKTNFEDFFIWIREQPKPEFFLSLLERNELRSYKQAVYPHIKYIQTILIKKIQEPTILIKLKEFGAARKLPPAFDPFMESLVNDRVFIVYDDLQNGEVLNGIKNLNGKIKSNFILFILDKAGQNGANEGFEFIKNDLDKAREHNDIKYISMLLTSQPKNDLTQEPIDFFRRELTKNSTDIIEQTEEVLLLAAYAHFILEFEKYYTDSIAEVRTFSLKNYKNFASVLHAGHDEGIAPFQAMTDWLNIILDFHTHKKILSDYINVFGLTSFFANKVLDKMPQAELDFNTIKEQYQEIRSFEIFDFDINKKHLPPSPGDIFFNESKKEYQILIGQACDMSMRYEKELTGKACRKLKVAQMLCAKFVASKASDKKCEVKNFQIILRDFKNHVLDIGNLVINVNEQTTSDFDIIDSCMFNKDGTCQIVLNQELPATIIKVLPLGKDKNYKVLQEKAQEKVEIVHHLQANSQAFANFNNLISQHVDYSTFNFIYNEQEKLLVYPIKRVARIRKSFFNLIYKKFLDHQGRIDLNLLDTIAENTKSYPIEIHLASKKYKESKEASLNVYTYHDEEYISLEELKQQLKGYEHTKKLSFESEIKLDKQKAFCEETKLGIEVKEGKVFIKLPIILPNGNTHESHEITIKKLFSNFPNPLNITTIQCTINGEDEATKQKLSVLDEIDKGIVFPEIKKQISLSNGKVIATDSE